MRDGTIAADGSPQEILLNRLVVEELGLEPPAELLKLAEVMA